MRKFTKTFIFLVITGFLFASCNNGDPTTKNPNIAKLSETSKKAIDNITKKGCDCLKTHNKELKSVIEELKPIMAEAEKQKGDPMEMMGKIMGPMMKMQAFGECQQKTMVMEDEAVNKALEEDFKKIVNSNKDKKGIPEISEEITLAYFSKNCPKEAKLLDELSKLDEQMSKISKGR
jgi:hypothetical protein